MNLFDLESDIDAANDVLHMHGIECPLLATDKPGMLTKDGEDRQSYRVPSECHATVYVDKPDLFAFKLRYKDKDYQAKWTRAGELEYRLGAEVCRGLLNVPRCWAMHAIVGDIDKGGDARVLDIDKSVDIPEEPQVTQERKWIPLRQMENRCVYLCDARNFKLGIWMGGMMHGMRAKWGDRFLDSEFHLDQPTGTCKPLVKLTEPLTRLDKVSNLDFRGRIVMEDILESMEQLFQGMAKLNEPSDVFREVYP